MSIQEFLDTLGISIHAPTRGATVVKFGHCAALVYFNPRSHEGSDGGVCSLLVDWLDFNPRSHEGSDTAGTLGRYTTANFNPRSHEGSDTHRSQNRGRRAISIHAPTRGATSATMITGR